MKQVSPTVLALIPRQRLQIDDNADVSSVTLGLCHSYLRLLHNWRRSTKNTCYIFSYWSRIVDWLLNHWRVFLNVNKYSIAVLSCQVFTLVEQAEDNSAICIQFGKHALKAKNDTGEKEVVFEVSKFIFLILKQIALLKGKA